jgi:hypothetical protein
MVPRRLSLAALMGIVIVAGLGLASLRFATVLWTAAATTVTLALLLSAVLGSLFLRGYNRAYWVGFALFGGVYLVLVDWSWIGAQVGYDLTAGLREFAETVHPPVSAINLGPRNPSYELSRARDIKIGNFVQITRLSLSLAFAWLGGMIGRFLWSWDAAQSRKQPDLPGPGPQIRT